MIKAFLTTRFGAKVQFELGDQCEMNVKCKLQLEVKKWVVNELAEFLSKDFPDEWEDSLTQFCSHITVRLTPLQQTTQLYQQVQQ